MSAPSGGTAVPSGVAGVTVSGTGDADTGVLVPQATVFDVSAPSSASGGGVTLLVSVEVTSSVAAEVATASAAGQVGLVLLPQAGSAGSAGSTGSAGPTGSAGSAGPAASGAPATPTAVVAP